MMGSSGATVQASTFRPAGTRSAPPAVQVGTRGHAAGRLAVRDGVVSLTPLWRSAELEALAAARATVRRIRTTHSRPRRPLTAQQIARRLLPAFHWANWQFQYLDLLWTRESGWNVYAQNPYTGAYGIPQAVPGSKMASAGPDWQGSARTQVRWGLRYIQAQYGSPLAAWQHELSTGWY